MCPVLTYTSGGLRRAGNLELSVLSCSVQFERSQSTVRNLASRPDSVHRPSSRQLDLYAIVFSITYKGNALAILEMCKESYRL